MGSPEDQPQPLAAQPWDHTVRLIEPGCDQQRVVRALLELHDDLAGGRDNLLSWRRSRKTPRSSQPTSTPAVRPRSSYGFVVRPDHVHAIFHFPDPDPIRRFLKPWKPLSSVQIQRLFRGTHSSFARSVDLSEPVWQARYYDFNLFSAQKVEETLIDLHQDPVRAGLAAHPCDWPWSSARYDEQGRTVGVTVGWLD